MSASLSQTLTLEEFLKLPYLEESPAWEYVDGLPSRSRCLKLDTLFCKSDC